MDLAQLCSQAQGKVLPSFVRAICRLPPGGGNVGFHKRDSYLDDPEKVEYLRRLLEAYYESQVIVACYNVAIVLVILVLAVQHWRETRRDRPKWRRLRGQGADIAHGTSSSPTTSLSSSTSSTPSPEFSEDLDIEQLPLLPGRRTGSKSRKNAIRRAVSSWFARQPRPIPIINKTLPPNGTSLFILAWLVLNVFFQLFRLPLDPKFFFIFADRIGFLFIVNLPLLYLLSAKNQPLRTLTGHSYEALNIFHRRVGEWMCFIGLVHFITMASWHLVLAEDWLAAQSVRAYFTHPVVLFGIGTFMSYELLYFTSLASFRQRWYELFLASHVLLQTAALIFLFFHFDTSRPYVAISLAIFLADRLIWRLTLKRADITMDLLILDKDTLLLSADWDIPPPSPNQKSRWWQPRNQSILHGWNPTDHIFLTVPSLAGRFSSSLQSHPFTIASAAPGRHPPPSASPGPQPPQGEHETGKHAWLSLLIRSRTGFTRDLMLHALTNAPRLRVRLDGPYGSPHALRMVQASGCAVLVAGGSGIAVVFPVVWALLCGEGEGGHEDEGFGDGLGDENKGKVAGRRERRGQQRQKRRVHLLWVTHARAHREWVPGMQLAELEARGLDLVIPEPTEEVGRPDVGGIVNGWIEGAAAEGREVGVVVSGPDGMNRAVRNVCAGAVGKGRDVRVAVEKFGW